MKQFLCILFIFTSLSIYAQKSLNSSWQPAKVEFEDGSVQEGYIKNFMRNSTKRFRMTGMTKDKVNDNRFKFKSSVDSKSKTIRKKNIKNVQLIHDDNIWRFDKLDLRSLNRHGKPMKSSDNTFLLLYNEGEKASVYMKTFEAHNKILDAPVYLKSYQDEFAIPYFEIKLLNVFTLFNQEKMLNKFKNSLKWVTRDCPKMIETIEEIQQVRHADVVQENTHLPMSPLDALVQFFDTYHQECN